MTTDHEIEQEIQAKGKTAPRVTLADIEANIASEHYFTAQEAVFDDRDKVVAMWRRNGVACFQVAPGGF